MPSGSDFLSGLNRYCILLLGDDDTGKSRQALSFPAPYVAASDPAGLAIAKLDPKLRRNLAQGWVEYLVPAKDALKDFFVRDYKKRDLRPHQNLYAMLADVEAKAKEERVQTLVYDPLSYLATTYMEKLLEYDRAQFVAKNGELDKRAMYGDLRNWLQQFIIGSLLPATQFGPHGLNVVVTCHLMRESEEKAAGVGENNITPINKGVDIKASILGSYRDHVTKPFGAALVFETDVRQFEKRDAKGQPVMQVLKEGAKPTPVLEERKVHWCYCSKATLKKSAGAAGFGDGVIQAKDKYGLLERYGPRFKMTGMYLYDMLQEIHADAQAQATADAVPPQQLAAAKGAAISTTTKEANNGSS
jgi:hypothetical protein